MKHPSFRKSFPGQFVYGTRNRELYNKLMSMKSPSTEQRSKTSPPREKTPKISSPKKPNTPKQVETQKQTGSTNPSTSNQGRLLHEFIDITLK